MTKKNVKTICLPTTEESQIENVDKPARDKMLISGNFLSCYLKPHHKFHTIIVDVKDGAE